MKGRYWRILQGFAGLVVTVAVAALINAQGGSAPRRADPVQREQQRQFELQMIEAALEPKQLRESVRKDPRVMGQIREDFLRIQVIDRELRQTAAAEQQLDFAGIAKSMTEIRKRALRLKTNLALPEREATLDSFKAEPVTNPVQLRSSLSALSDSIYEFVSNPFFVSAKVVDAQLSLKAREDLEQIIELSNNVKTGSEKLKVASRRK